MSKTAFGKIAAGLEDAIAFARGDDDKGRITRAIDVKAVRAATRKTQAEFARAYALPVTTLRDWEQGRRRPEAPARVLLSMIEAEPETVERLVMKTRS